jgi:two-component system sensor histidine kinase CiaH
MFHSAALKLTLWYLGIIMTLSICFSVIIYNLSSNELLGSNRRQDFYLNDRLPGSNFTNFSRLRSQDLSDALHKLRSNLIIFNLLVVAAGGVASYALARRTLEPIEEALEAQKRFTGDASHELRTPLTVMQTENEVALRDPSLTKQAAIDQLGSNLEEVAKLKALSDGLLKLASIESAGAELAPVAIKPIVQAVLERWQPAADDKKVELTNQITNFKVLGDRESLTELVSLLLDNAIKYSRPGSRITLSSARDGKSGRILIKDNGEGIKAEHLPKIFERFYRADPARSTSGGYGLGLSIAKRIVELHKGSIEVSSAPGKGSTFTVSLHTA